MLALSWTRIAFDTIWALWVGITLEKAKSEAVLKETADVWGVDAKSEMYKLPAMYVGEYAEQDATSNFAVMAGDEKRNRTSRYTIYL